MTNRTVPSVHSYLDELDRALRDLPHSRRQEITDDIRTHIDAALADAPEQTPAVIANILDHLGTPTDIAEAARADLPPVRPRIAARDVITIVLLLIGGFIVPFLGWVVGAAMLWISTAWRTKDKLIATLLVPGGLLAPLLLGGIVAFTKATSCATTGSSPSAPGPSGGDVVQHCTTIGEPGTWFTILAIVLLIITVAGPVFSTIWLTRHAQRTT